MSPLSHMLSQFNAWPQPALWQSLTEPASEIEKPEDRRQARLISSLLLPALLLTIMGAVFGGPPLPIVLVLGLVYGLSRTRHYMLAAALSVVIMAAPSFILIATATEHSGEDIFYTLGWLGIAVTLAGLVLETRTIVLITGAIISGILSFPLWIDDIGTEMVFAPASYILVLSVLVILATAIRQRFARQIDQQFVALQNVQAQLRQSNEQLEQRVEERTVTLRGANARLQEEIVERKRTEESLSQAHDRALEALRLKEQIFANVSHDARTPLSVMILHIDRMLEGRYGPVTEEQRGVGDQLIGNAEQLLKFIDNLLSMAQAEASKVSPQHITLSQWLAYMVEMLQPLAENKGLVLSSHIAADMPETVFCDPDHLERVCTNLIHNAIKFTEKGSVKVCVKPEDELHWALEVSDTGIGLRPDEQEHIFEAFWQADGSHRRRASRGVGLGLSIVKQFVSMLDGDIRLDSTVDRGTTFTIILPFQLVQSELSNGHKISRYH